MGERWALDKETNRYTRSSQVLISTQQTNEHLGDVCVVYGHAYEEGTFKQRLKTQLAMPGAGWEEAFQVEELNEQGPEEGRCSISLNL